MEAAVLFKTADLILKLLGPPLSEKIRSIWKNEEEINMLADTIDYIGDVLSDVEGKQFEEASVNKGYKRLREAFLDAEDFLDRVQTLKKQQEADTSKFKKARRFFSRSNQAKYAIEMHNAIKEIKKQFDVISQDRQKFGLKEPHITSEATRTSARASGSYVDVTRIIGREEDKRIIVDLFQRTYVGQQKIRVISIVGMGGIGKTTVAQLVYDDESWQESCKFDMKLWVSNSKKFHLKSLLKNIVKAMSPSNTSLDNLEEDHLRDKLVEGIRAKRFFLVLDDVEDEDPWIWETFETLLNYANKEESRILVTTRSRKVADVVGSPDSTYQLSGLSKKNSLQLFGRYAFREKRDENLVEIGEHIVSKCLGVPLALKVIGALLCGEEQRKWELVRDIGLAKIKNESNQIMAILKISFDHLDSSLKRCFSYCSVFPKNHLTSKEILSSIWMDNVRFKTNEGETLEDVCDKNFKILYNRCFLEVVKRNYWEDDTYFKIHDLMHDLAKEVAGAEILVADSDAKADSNTLLIEENVRHLNLMYPMNNVGPSTFQFKGRRLRTLLRSYFFYCREPFSFNKLVTECPVLRFLDVGGCKIETLTDSIGMLTHLRYLDLSVSEFKTLPESLTMLINLRHLKLVRCTALINMPSGMGALTSLEVLDMCLCDKLKDLPMGIEKLIKLKKLKLVGCKALTHLPFGLGALTSLQVLDMSSCDRLQELPMSFDKLIKLKDLKLVGCNALTHLPLGMGALTSLQVLDISSCRKLKDLPMGIEKLTNLKALNLVDCYSLAQMPSGMGALMSICKPARFLVGYPESNHGAQLEELKTLSGLQEELIVEIPNNIILKAPTRDSEAFLLKNRRLRRTLGSRWTSWRNSSLPLMWKSSCWRDIKA